jgi:hypothetical protein
MSCAFTAAIMLAAPKKTSPFLASANPSFLWNEIVRWSFEACILRRQGQESKVTELLQERLPSLIRAWSARSGLTAIACKERLRGLFGRVQESVELGFLQQRLIVDEICTRMAFQPVAARLPRATGSVGLRRQVPFGNIPDMLDALAEAEFEAMGEAVLPVRRAVLPPEDLFVEEPAAQVALSA